MASGLTMDKLVALANNRGFVFAGSEIYGGLANAWDYGPLGVELKNNVAAAWWRKFVRECPYNSGIDSAILMNSEVWVASGHVGGFNDPLVDCRQCKTRYRADNIIKEWNCSHDIDTEVEGWPNARLKEYIEENRVPCPDCGACDFTDIRQFNMMFKTHQGVTEDSKSEVYLRPETAQGIFVNFRNMMRATRKKMPFGVGQIGKAFRNEITPGNFIFRTREFEQAELEFFCRPGTDLEWFDYWRTFCKNWLTGLGIKEDNLRMRDHAQEELAFYSNATTDIEYLFPFGWSELWGIADRTDYDLRQHMEHAREDLSYFDPLTNEKYVPYCIEPSLGITRAVLAFLCDAYDEEDVDGETRVVLRLHPALAPVRIAVLPLSKKLGDEAGKLYDTLVKSHTCEYDDTGSIGKRYRRQDETGTPYCITFDFDSLEDRCVTIRERDSMKQVRIPIDSLESWFTGKFDF